MGNFLVLIISFLMSIPDHSLASDQKEDYFSWSSASCAKYGINEENTLGTISDSTVRRSCGDTDYRAQELRDLSLMQRLHREVQAELLTRAAVRFGQQLYNARLVGSEKVKELAGTLEKNLAGCPNVNRKKFVALAQKLKQEVQGAKVSLAESYIYRKRMLAAAFEFSLLNDHLKDKNGNVDSVSEHKINLLRDVYPQLLPHVRWTGSGARDAMQATLRKFSGKSMRAVDIDDYLKENYGGNKWLFSSKSPESNSNLANNMLFERAYAPPQSAPNKGTKDRLFWDISKLGAGDVPQEALDWMKESTEFSLNKIGESVDLICSKDDCDSTPAACKKKFCQMANLSRDIVNQKIATEPSAAAKNSYERVMCGFCGNNDTSTGFFTNDEAKKQAMILVDAGVGVGTTAACFFSPIGACEPVAALATTYYGVRAGKSAIEAVGAYGDYQETGALAAAGLVESAQLDEKGKVFAGKVIQTLGYAGATLATGSQFFKARQLVRAATAARQAGYTENQILGLIRSGKTGQKELTAFLDCMGTSASIGFPQNRILSLLTALFGSTTAHAACGLNTATAELVEAAQGKVKALKDGESALVVNGQRLDTADSSLAHAADHFGTRPPGYTGSQVTKWASPGQMLKDPQMQEGLAIISQYSDDAREIPTAVRELLRDKYGIIVQEYNPSKGWLKITVTPDGSKPLGYSAMRELKPGEVPRFEPRGNFGGGVPVVTGEAVPTTDVNLIFGPSKSTWAQGEGPGLKLITSFSGPYAPPQLPMDVLKGVAGKSPADTTRFVNAFYTGLDDANPIRKFWTIEDLERTAQFWRNHVLLGQ